MCNNEVGTRKKRERVASRDEISYDDKIRILRKTDGLCSHCGRRIEVGGQFTLEHVIPLKHGGTNDMRNLVPLCRDCNHEKDDRMVMANWYKYLKPEVLDDVAEHIEEFHKSHEIIGHNYFDAYDIITFGYGDIKGRDRRLRLGTAECQKAYYSDLDNIYRFYINYFRDVLIKMPKNEIKQFISDCFRFGAIYFMRDSSGRVECVLPLIPARHEDTEEYTDIMAMYPATKHGVKSYRLYSMLFGMLRSVEDNICESIGSKFFGTVIRAAYYDKDLVEHIGEAFPGIMQFSNVFSPSYVDFTVSSRLGDYDVTAEDFDKKEFHETRSRFYELFKRGYTIADLTSEDLKSGHIVIFNNVLKFTIFYKDDSNKFEFAVQPNGVMYYIDDVSIDDLVEILSVRTIMDLIDYLLEKCNTSIVELYHEAMKMR